MLVYELYHWVRRPKRGSLERERQRGCMLLLTIVSLIYLHSGEAPSIQSAFVRAIDGLFRISSQPAKPTAGVQGSSMDDVSPLV